MMIETKKDDSFELYLKCLGVSDLDFNLDELLDMKRLFKKDELKSWIKLYDIVEAKVSLDQFEKFTQCISCHLSPSDYKTIKKLYLLTDQSALNGNIHKAQAYWHSLMIIVRSLDCTFVMKKLSPFDGAIPNYE